MALEKKVYDDTFNIMCDHDLKLRLRALAKAKGTYGFSPIVRSILTNAVPVLVEQLSPEELVAYNAQLKAERDMYAALTGKIVEQIS